VCAVVSVIATSLMSNYTGKDIEAKPIDRAARAT
jgi:hypothetical protein